ncbi:type II toxin-antitoxin system Phd/YefM family antitoxin [Herbaspirillum robiniae]|uniref:Prevent-host-death protein n=1 Tax=Herbaspirillum robiniae TaxID=2014887 RepID=A0A246WNL6_9BURK|nr:type II toxin-antitoxin system Phd/YefM family antitoxin [Herbaspirillum robiniae]OWY27964.1 prevent-host-death protein [Herbaspirillum robiniae]
MAITTLSDQEFAQGVLMALCATEDGPVIITDGAVPTHVLLSFQAYQELLTQRRNIAASLAMPGVADVEFDAPRCNIYLRKANFT